MRLLWRMADEPIIALDGDTAGLRAAMRVIDIALPLLEAGKSLRFAVMPEGLDPDDLIKAQGPGAMQKLLDQALPMVQLLWQRETDGKIFDSPERKAALDKALRDKIKLIADPSIRAHYGQAVKDLRWAFFSNRSAPKRRATQRWSSRQEPWRRDIGPVAASKSSALGAGAAHEDHLRVAVILATMLGTPHVAVEFESALEQLDVSDPDYRAIHRSLLRNLGHEDLRVAVASDIGQAPLEKLMTQNHVSISPGVRRAGDDEIARLCLAEEFAKLAARRGHAREIEDAVEDLSGVADEGLTWRLAQATAAVDRAGRGDDDDRAEYDVSDNGMLVNKDERDAFDQLLDQIGFAKKGLPPKS